MVAIFLWKLVGEANTEQIFIFDEKIIETYIIYSFILPITLGSLPAGDDTVTVK